jgi:hypothetical protein
MLTPLQKTPEPAKPAYTPTLRPAQPFFAPAHRPVVAPPFFPPARTKPAPAAALLAAVPAVLEPAVDALAHLARQQAPYQLLAHALGHDPLTGRPVPAAPQALARTLLGLLPDGEARYQQLQAAGPALAQLPAWLRQQLAAHQLGTPRLTQVLAQTWTQLHALGLRDALDPAAALARLTQPWLHLGRDVARFVGHTEAALLRWLVTAVLGPEQAAPVLKALDQGGDLLLRILRHPLPFLTNLVTAGKRGFANFLANGPRHLLAAVQDWLLGGLAQAGLRLPARLDVAGIIDVLLQVFALTKAAVLHRLRQRLPSLPTERLQQVLTQVGGVALALWQHGPQAAWQAISQQAGDLRAQALDLVQQQVLGVAAQAVPLFLASLAVPGGAFVQVARGLYHGVLLFVEKGKQIAQVGQALFASAAAIAAGQLAPAATAVENTLVKVLPVALAFLARQLGLDGLSGAIQTGLKKVQGPVEKAVNKVLDTIAEKANALWGTLKAGAGRVVEKGKAVATAAAGKVAGWLDLRKPFTVGTEQHTLFFEEAGLMVASKKQSYQAFIESLAQQVQRASPLVVSAYRDAIKLAGQIDKALRPSQLDGQQTADTTRLTVLLQALAAPTTVLMQASGSLAVPDAQKGFPSGSAKPDFGGLTPGGFGRAMTMAYLTSARDVGSEASAKGNAVYDTLNQRFMGGRSYYVRGHLLSRKLHGTGSAWVNLTPLTNFDNGEHERQVEGPLKKAFEASRPRAFLYSVLPTYGRGINQALIQQLYSPAQTLAQPDPDAATKEAIIRAEQYVPLNLVCTVQEVNYLNRQESIASDLSKTTVIANTIDQRSPQSYQLTKISAVYVNDTQNPLILQGLGFTKQEAEQIIQATIAGKQFKGRQELLQTFPNLSSAMVAALVSRRYLKFD